MDDKRRPERLIRLTDAARNDLASVDNATAATWGEVQAERYLAFLSTIFELIADQPRIGTLVDDFPGIRVYSAKIVKRKSAHGHRIFYREIEGGVRIIRILHTAMNWSDHLFDPPSN